MKNLFLIILSMFCLLNANSQTQNESEDEKEMLREITGIIYDVNLNPVQNITIRTNRSKKSVISDENGVYKIMVATKDRKLLISANGMETAKTTIVPDINIIDIILSIEKDDKNQENTSNEDMEGKTIGDTYYTRSIDTSLRDIFEGRFAGVNVVGSFVQIRGRVCTYYLIDGFKQYSLAGVNPLSIKSVKIIKDVNETNIYGRDARNGIVVVELK